MLRDYTGVISTRVGYSGGTNPNATYRNHGTHAEAVEIVFDPAKLSFRTLLEFFFQIHDPSTKDQQGNDRGASYRSAIFYTNDEQKRVALGYLHEAWAEARIDGVDGDCLAQACLFAAFAEFVATYGEDAAAQFAEGLAVRIRNGEFSLATARQ